MNCMLLIRCRIPMDPQQRQEWLREITKHQKINGTFSVCQLHFEEKYLKFVKDSRKAKLLPNAVPTIFATNPSIQTFVFVYIKRLNFNDFQNIKILFTILELRLIMLTSRQLILNKKILKMVQCWMKSLLHHPSMTIILTMFLYFVYFFCKLG